MASLDHPGIVTVIEPKCEEEGLVYYVMDYLAGGDLQQAIDAGDPEPDRLITIIMRVGEALEHAHARGIIHRDIKPANILLDAAGNPELTDFDLVRAADSTGMTRTSQGMGTLLFAAPEALGQAKDVTPAADVYSLAMTCLAGLSRDPLSFQVVRSPEPILNRLSCGPATKRVIATALEWNLNNRTSTVGAFSSNLMKAWIQDQNNGPAAEATSEESPRPRSVDRGAGRHDLEELVKALEDAVGSGASERDKNALSVRAIAILEDRNEPIAER